MSIDLREKRLQSLSPAKRALLLEALRKKEGQGRQEPRIPQRAETGHAPLSFAQQRLWFLDQLAPDSPLYNIPVALRAEGPLDVGVLARSLGEIVRRHEALRTVFAVRESEPVQRIQPPGPCALPVVDLSGLPESRREAAALSLAGNEATRPFDLARGPLLRGLLLRLAAEDHVAALTLHHIVSDGWSMGIVVREVASLYPAFAEGRPSPLPELPVQYGDFAAWQRSGSYSELLESEVSFWRRQLAGLPPLLELPTDRPRPATQSYRGATRPVLLPAGLARRAEALARREGATVFMVLLAGFQALLARHSGQDDLAVGTPVAGRNQLEIEGLIGFFVNTLVLRGDLSGKPSFRELLGRVRETALAAYAHQNVPFERLVQELAPERSLAHAPLFQVMFALQNAPVENLEIRDLRLRPMAVAGTTAKFDLMLTLEEHDGGWAGTVEHATDLFDGTTIDRLIAGFERLLAAALTAPELSAPELPLLDEAERWQILREWNDTGAHGLAEGCLHQHVAAQAARTPEAVAVELGDERWTYRRLVGSARRLARHLRTLGVGPDVIVGLSAERSQAMVAGMLAVLEAGGAWLPLDPAYPAERLAFMLDDSGARVLLIQEPLLPRVPAAGRSVVLLDGRWDAGDNGEDPEGDLGVEVTPDHLAYVIYTSGSTGRPKGVMVPHRGVVNRLRWAQQIYQLGPSDAVLQKASFSFDFSVWECFAPLSAGARLVLAEPGRQGDGAYLVRTLCEHRVTFVHFVPSMLAAFLGEEGVETCTSLRQVFSGGEALTPELRDRVLARLPAPLDNQYGPTEISIDTTRWVCAPGQDPHRVAIGRPIANSRLYVVDPELRPLPIDVAGELLVGGLGVTRGYLRMPALTAERFVPDPFAVEPGARLYRTGDLVRWTRAGHLEFLGRIDHQVKVRGFRIELGEIEAALAFHPQVLESAVLLREDRPGDQRLVAYMVPVGSAKVETAELRAFLRHSLPEFMVPATFVSLTSMPISPNGKVDRRALPQPVDGSEHQGDYLAPRTPIEELLAGIWSDLLRVEEIGVNDDFFELGGHSLQGIRLVARIREVLGVDLPVRALFQAPTLAALAASIADEMLRRAEQRSDAGGIATGQELAGDRLASVIAQLQEKQRSIGMTRIRPVEKREGPLPLSFAQERLWFLEQLEPGTAFYNIPGTVRIEGELRFEVLVASLEEVTRRHESLRTTFGELAGQPYQRVGPDSRLTVPIVDLTALPLAGRESELRQLATDESRRPFDLARGPLMRVVLFRLGTGDQVIVYTTHHIISDGWSALIFLREIAALYAALSTGRPASLPSLPVQYVDYAAWQRTYLAGSVLEAQLSYWRDRLAGAPGLELPTDRPRPAIESFRGGSHSVRLPQEIGRALLALSRREGATLFMTLLALFKTLLLRYSGQTDLSVGSPIANRNRSEVEGVIGFFANTVVLRTDLHGNPSFRELLMRVREVALGAYAHEDLPFERIVEELQPERDMSRNPLFQVMCVLQNQPQESLPAGDLRMSPLSIELAIAKFDLTLFWYEEQGWISGLLEYNTDLFDRSTALRFYQHYERLLEAVLANPGQPLLSLPLLGEAERHQIASEWSDTAAVAEDRCVHAWVEAQVERIPEAIAAVFGEQRLTYRELNLRANRLAHGLIRHGVGPESLVGICVDRSLEMVVAALAVLKAGGGLVALDPAYPRERLATIIEDAGLAILLTQEPLLRQFPRHRNIALCLAPGVEPFPLESGENPQIGLTPDHPMYVIYTSGSTGQPKGIVVTHRAFANLASWQLGNSPLAGGLRTVQFAAFGFCVSFQEIFSAWCSGGTLVVADEMIRRDSERLAELLASESIDRLHLPFAALKQLADVRETFARQPMRLTEIITAGEQLRVTPAVRDLLEQLPGCSLHNQYGASETHVVCELALRGNAAGWPAIPSVGRPIRNVRIHLLDSQLEPVPIGVRGGLYAAGACLARAYLNDPVLTAQKMVPDPFAKEPGSRLYRTGDLARHLCDGQIEFLGRADGQVKIRGFRVELGEVETALASHPRVHDAVAIAQPMEAAGLQLVAYVVAAEGDLVIEELRGYLKQRLPEYMIPSVFMQLEALPVTANGKLDQAALPVPEASGGPADYVAPRTLAEELLAGLWAEVLHRERVGATDNFFEIGGHSLLATQVVSRARSAFGVELPVRALFEAPTVLELANRIETARRGEKEIVVPPIRPVPRDRNLPLSFAQQRLWFIDQLEPGRSSYNISVALRVEGPLDPSALARSLQEIVWRHEILRTVFAMQEGVPVQVIQPAAPFPVALVDLSGLPEPARQEQAANLAAEKARRPFDLTHDPLLRCALLRLAENDHVLALTMHHIAADGWSASILTREIGVVYRAIREGRCPELPPLPVQYADFAVWQRSWLQGETLANQLAWWRERLAGAPTILDLPTDRPRPAVLSPAGAVEVVELPATLYQRTIAAARQEEATPFMLLLAIFGAFLGGLTGREDLLVGIPVGGRNRPELDGLIGLFLNTLLLRQDLSGDPDFQTLLRRVRDASLEAYARQDLPFDRLVEELNPERDLSRTPLYQVQLNFLNVPRTEIDFSGGVASSFPVPEVQAKLDLAVYAEEVAGRLVLRWIYNARLFDASTIRRAVSHFIRLLEAAVEEPRHRIFELPLLSPEEVQQIRLEWNDTHPAHRPGLSIPERFFAAAERWPERIALRLGEEALTYGELESRVRRRAAELRLRGLGPETMTALCFERSFVMVEAVLAVLAAGGAYVALDPHNPKNVQASVLQEVAPGCLLTQEHLLASLPLRNGTEALALDRTERAGGSGRELPTPPDPRSLAYVAFTSGSTGTPKGILGVHGSAASYLSYLDEIWPLSPEDRVLQLARLSFDASIRDLLYPLTRGASVVLLPDSEVRDPSALLREIELQGVTCILGAVPSLLHALVETAVPGEGGRNLRLILASGEPLPLALCQRVRDQFGGVRIANQYGPSECTLTSTLHQVPPDASGMGVALAGRPIPGMRCRVLGSRLREVPVGVAGQVFLGGLGVTRGYLNRPDLTAERFLPDPFSSEPGERLYATGDLGRQRPDGALEVLGRLDHQVKIRGIRLELGEVEAVLAAHPEVSRAVATVREGRLVAYVVGRGEPSPANGLRRFLEERLPEHAVPSLIIPLKSLPLNANGKVDRSALPAPGDRSRAAAIAPRDVQELQLVSIWEKVLDVHPVGVTDDFFELGGHSLLAVRLLALIERQFGQRLPLTALFQARTVERLAAWLRERERAVPPSLVPLREGGIKTPRFWVHPVGGTVFSYMELAAHLASEGPFFAFQAPGLAGEGPPLDSIDALAARYLAELRTARPAGPYRLGGWSLGGIVAFEMARRLREQGEEIEELVLVDSRAHAPEAGDDDELELWTGFARELGLDGSKVAGEALELEAGELLRLGAEERLQILLNLARRAGLLPPDAAVRDLGALFAVFAAGRRALRSYRPRPYPGPVLFFEGTGSGRGAGWKSLVEGELEVVELPGDHRTIMRGEGARLLARHLGRGESPPASSPAPTPSDPGNLSMEIEGSLQRCLMSIDLRENRLRSLSPAKRALLLEALRQKEGQGRQEPRIPRRVATGHAPLSFAQERLWFLDQLEPGRALYNIPVALRIEGPLESRALALCLGEIVRRHEALRTIFGLRAGVPVQLVQPAAPFELPVVDLSELPETAREATALRLAGEEAGRPFDLARGPLLRGVLLCLAGPGSPTVHAAMLTMHHITSDGWSMGLLVREVASLYPAFAEGRPSPLPELPVQYGDFAAWQRSWLHGEHLESEISFWRRQLAGLPPLLTLPTDRPRPAAQSYRGATRPVLLPPGLARRAEALARREGATVFMVLLAGFQALLARYSGQDDLAVGTPVAGRNQLEIEGLIGFFVNTLVLRGDLSGKPSFRELLGRVRETALAAYAHQDVPFERLVQELAPERSLAHPPLFQVMFALQNAPVESLEIRDLRLRSMGVAGTTAKFDLTLTLEEHGGGLSGTVEHATDLFDGTTIDRLIAGFERLLAAALNAPELSVPELPLLGEAERWQSLGEWNDTGAAGLAEGCLHQHVAAQAARTPEAVAVELGDERWTYRRLVRSARRLARHLRELGVGPDVIVGLSAERSPAMVAGMLAVLEAGGAWLPLDPAYPAERLAFMLDDSRARVLLIQEHLLERVPAANRRVVLLDARWDSDEETQEALGVEVSPDNLAYVIYTSGSTGRPKGVMVPHRGVVNRLRWAQQVYRLDGSDAVLQKASFGFDFSVWECFAPLSAGARLVLAEPGRQGEGAYLVRALREHRVTFVHFVPSMLAAFLGEEDVESCVSLRQVFSGGEALTPELRDLALARLPAPLDNQYGPTEISIDTTRWVCAPGQELHRVPIGRPIANSRLYVVDPELRPVPVGMAGELLVGGAGVTRGYLRRPDLTAERFVPDPFAAEPGARLYHTGDLGRLTREGTLEFLGRIDHQVKIRGFRIELGEIEAALVALDGVREAVVLAREDRADRRLVAYVVGDVAADELRRSLRDRLPDYMVPAAFVVLEALLLTPSGKVDRKALPAPEWQSSAESYVAPRTPVEEVLAGVWADVLGLERVGVEDDFFSLGGHSLLATRLVSRLRDLFGREVPLRLIFEAPTVAALAEKIAALCEGGSLPPILPAPRGGNLPLSFAQQRLWFLDRLAPGNPFYNIFGAVRLTGALDVDALERAFREIVRRHESLRTTFRMADDVPIQVIAPRPDFEVPRVDLESLSTERFRGELARLSHEESLRPFDLARGPLLRACLVRLAAREHALLVNLHHIVSDGWSMGILVRELTTLYGAFSQGVPSPLPELPIQYADFALWQRQWLQGERLEAELDHWRRQLAGIPEVLELPYDHPRPAIDSFRGGTQSFVLPAALVRELTALTRRHGATLSMTMLAGFKALLARYSGREDLAVGVAIANRTRREVEGLIGFFVNTLVFRSDLTGSPGLTRLLARVRETALAAYAHQDLPFERLVEELQPERDLSRNPLIQVMFGFQNFPRADAEIQGLVVSSPGEGQVSAQTAKFDLTLFLFEDGELLQGALEYNSDLFEATTLKRLLRHFENLLAAAVTQPERSMALLPLLTETERHQLATEWNAGATGPDASLQELFEAQVRRVPEAPALVFGEGVLSYAELNRRANRLAHRLLRLGAGPESRVGLCLERSPELIVGLLGILKAGGAYVPLDPDYPRRRLTFMAEDSHLRVLVGQAATVRQLPESLVARVEVVLLDADPDADLEENPPVTTSGDSLAYVMYTSGSTGRPKGVAVPHRAVARLVRDTDFIRLGPDQVFLQFAPVSFDASTLEIWGPLLNSGRLVIPPPHALSLEELGREIERHGVTTLWLTAGLFHQFVESHLDLLRPVRQLLAGGDVLSVAHVRRVLAELPETRLINGYGPTENTTFTCCHRVQGAERLETSVPIGRPIAHTWVHLLDSHGQPVPLGVVGELCTGGAGLARGYLGKPDLTAERFVPDPLTGGGNRLYRTGDLARRLPDGTIEFLGRIDQQVKVRGFRIELGEIEAHLGEHPAVLHNVVLAREDVPGDRRLVAYVVQDPAYGVPQGLESEVQTEQVSQWSEIFDDIYRREAAESDPTFNIIGWDSSYTGLPLPGTEMEEWLEDTIDRIAALAPRRVLEIGCGTGMILFRIARGSEAYTGTDISARALGYVESHLDAAGVDRPRVQLLRRPAERFDGMAAGSYDTVILNSVVQYFPGADYLAEVIARAAEVVRPGGAIFLGDLRSLPLLDAFDTSVELFQADPETPVPHLRQRLHARRLHENELCVAPAFFQALRQRVPGVGRVEIYPKRGEARNELTAFRYQAVLRIGDAEEKEIPFRDWQAEGLTLASLRRVLEQDGPAVLGLCDIPNARTAEAAAAVRLLREAEEGVETAGDLRRRAAEAAQGAVDPQDLWDLGRELPYDVELSQANPDSEGRFEAVLLRRREGAGPISALLPAPRVASTGPLAQYTNNPLQGRFARQIAPELRAFLTEKLPDYMVPSAFVLLDTLPLSPNGKVDRRRLPAPDLTGLETGRPPAAPRSETEERLLGIWRQLLGIERIGVDDDFFALGGHSLLATQAVSRMRKELGVELPLRTFFEAPTVAALAPEVEALRRAGGEAEAPPIVPVEREGPLPLSFAQERLWFLHLLDLRVLAYNESAAFRLRGRLDEAAFRWSLDEVVRRHESLRTVFPGDESSGTQQVMPPLPFDLSSVDLRGLPGPLREKEAGRLGIEQARRPFDLARGPLARGLLVRLEEQEHAVLFFFHHIVFDGWSTAIFVRELSTLYTARVAGEPSPLPELPVQYADFAVWQRRWLQGEPLARILGWWREQLADVAMLALPTDRPRPALPQAFSGQRSLVLPPDLTRALRELSRSRGTTLFMTLLAAFQALLCRTTGQDDISIGTPIANRNRSEVEPLIGFFVNMLALRTRLAGDPGFVELLERVRQTAVGAYAHQDLPFEKLVEELRPARSLRHAPLFQVTCQLLNVPASFLDLPGLALHPFAFTARSTKFDLNLDWIDQGERLTGLLDYDADLFDATTAERFLAHLGRLLEGAAARPGDRLSELPLLTPAEHRQLVAEWNDTWTDLPAEILVHELFEAQARRTPEAVALVFEGQELLYHELDARADRLARLLRGWGVGPGVLVGLCVERSPEMVIGLLGILKAGGAYVPLDPAYPEDRLAFMLADARVPVLLTQERLLGRVDPKDARVLCLDSAWDNAASENAGHRYAPCDPDELAYVIYTSGSTGRPKGVAVPHRGLVSYLLWAAEAYPAGDAPVHSPLSFDLTVTSLFLPLLAGRRTVLVPEEQGIDGLAGTLTEGGFGLVKLTPAHLEILSRMVPPERAAGSALAFVIGGEALSGELLAFWRTQAPGLRLFNEYGPTETVVGCCVQEVPASARPAGPLPIGRPIANCRIQIVDSLLHPVPIGVPGELCIGGAGVCRGYLHRPDLTAERFAPDPFGARGERLYRSGDLARHLADGTIEYLGRIDHQVKLRGFRIELGEIEAALLSLPGVREAAVLADDLRLVAYVAGDLANLSSDALRQALRERLPDHMVPSAFVLLAELPLTTNGKVDRRALPAPEQKGPAERYVAPRTQVEEALAGIWADLLGFERVGATDDFFDLGGHSLLVVRLMARIEHLFGIKLPVSALFEAPTVERLAALIDRREAPARRSPLVRLHPGGAGRPLFVVHPVGGDVFAYVELARKLGTGRPVYGLQAVSGTSAGNGHPPSIERLAAQYLAAVREVQPEGPYFLAGWSFGAVVAYEMAQQIESSGESVALLTMIDPSPPGPGRRDELDDTALLHGFALDLVRLSGRRVAFGQEALEGLSIDAALDRLYELGQKEGVLPPDLDKPRLLERFDLFCRHAKALEHYGTRPYGGRVALFRASTSLAPGATDPAAEWSSLIRSETYLLEADHYSVLRSPALERLVEPLQSDLEKAETSAPSALTRSAG